MTASGIYRHVLEEIARALGENGGAAAAVDLLHERLDRYSWVGFYRVEGDELVLGPWRGPRATPHVRIPIGEGICGAAAASGATEVVDDVAADSRYLACFPSTRSEIVVPVVRDGRVVGEIDIDSDRPGAFDDGDRTFLEQVVRLLALADDDPSLAADGVVDEWGRGSFPASDPPARWAGPDVPATVPTRS
ncbi:MAG: GAF domain-containing protein [Gaiellaceae bacterium]